MDITIRTWTMADAPALAQILNNKNVQDNLRDGLPFPYTVTDAEAYISAMLSADRDQIYPWAILVDDTVAGSIGVFRKANVHRLTAEMGYYIAETHWGKGVMTEAIRQVCRHIWAHTDIVRIFAEPYANNIASCRALEKAGFVCEGTLRNHAIKHGVLLDSKMYARIK